VKRLRLDRSRVGYFRFKRLKDRFLLTNDFGHFIFLNPAEFRAFTAGRFEDLDLDVVHELEEKGMVREKMQLPRLINAFAAKNFCGAGPDLHIVVVTLRCTHGCVYCHAGAAGTGERGVDMTLATARKTLDRIFETPNKNIKIEFQGGEPLLNFEVIRFMVLEGSKRNRKAGKRLGFSVVSNLWPMTDALLDFLVTHKVQICTSLDGPAAIHDRHRPLVNGRATHGHTVAWIKKIQKRYARVKGAFELGALLTVTQSSLKSPKEIVDEYLRLGFTGVHLRPVNPFGISSRARKGQCVEAGAFLKFYRKALEHILRLNESGTRFEERFATIFLNKIFAGSDPGFLDLRSPCGAAIGQLAYNYDGGVYTCDEGRMLGRRGDESFRIGTVDTFRADTLGESDVVRSVCTASCLDVIPGCAECVYKPYCGVCPVYNHFEHGSIFSRATFLCRIYAGMLDILFEKLSDPKAKRILLGWVGIGRTAAEPKKKRAKGIRTS